MPRPFDTRVAPEEAAALRYWNRSRIVLVVLVYLMALGVAPLAHAYLTVTGGITGPDAMDDLACLSCHAANRGHITPPDRSCLSCHPMDFDRHLATARTKLHTDRIGSAFGVIIGAYSAFCLGALMFVLRPMSLPRVLFVLAAGLVLGGSVAAAFGKLA
ncbi:MAG TPA: hypothetical protein PKM88_12660 [bacterium]|nr:hypothetical protein [bacterium]